MDSQTLRLRDGRMLGFREFGDPNGLPMFYFHGFPGSRLEAKPAHPTAEAMGVRLLALDRPGFGRSDFQPGRQLVDWAVDVESAADVLGVERFGVLGASGGGPYVLAVAHALPKRVRLAAIVSGLGPVSDAVAGMGPVNRLGLALARWLPGGVYAGMWMIRTVGPQRMLRLIENTLAPPDRRVLSRADVLASVTETLEEGFAPGSKGAAHDLLLLARPWGFVLQDVRVPVLLWHGEADEDIPVSVGRSVAAMLPDCHATYWPGEGHLALYDRIGEVLGAICDRLGDAG
ncbi:MAG: alpha/beta hydrolase [Myxococcota bacterium]